jgi:hypothetical protein
LRREFDSVILAARQAAKMTQKKCSARRAKHVIVEFMNSGEAGTPPKNLYQRHERLRQGGDRLNPLPGYGVL